MRSALVHAIPGCASLAVLAVLLPPLSSWAGDDPSIKGSLRTDIHAAMNTYVATQTVDGTLKLYDAVDGKLLQLEFDNLHDGIVHKGDFYVSCADFVDQEGRKIDVDFLVLPDGDRLLATQAIVHSVDGAKRKYHLESR